RSWRSPSVLRIASPHLRRAVPFPARVEQSRILRQRNDLCIESRQDFPSETFIWIRFDSVFLNPQTRSVLRSPPSSRRFAFALVVRSRAKLETERGTKRNENYCLEVRCIYGHIAARRCRPIFRAANHCTKGRRHAGPRPNRCS